MFKIGDKVRVIDNKAGHDLEIGDTFNIIEINEGSYYYREHWMVYAQDIELIESSDSKGTLMNLKEKFVAAFLSEPEKSFRKAGITNGDGLLTEDGKTVFLSWLLKANGDKFKTEVVDELLKEEKV